MTSFPIINLMLPRRSRGVTVAKDQKRKKKVWATGINAVRDRSTWRGYSITSDGLGVFFSLVAMRTILRCDTVWVKDF